MSLIVAERLFVCVCCVMSEAWRGDDLGQVAVEEQSLEMQSCATKLSTIREVLLRRHMKVAFFGRYREQVTSAAFNQASGAQAPSGGHMTPTWM